MDYHPLHLLCPKRMATGYVLRKTSSIQQYKNKQILLDMTLVYCNILCSYPINILCSFPLTVNKRCIFNLSIKTITITKSLSLLLLLKWKFLRKFPLVLCVLRYKAFPNAEICELSGATKCGYRFCVYGWNHDRWSFQWKLLSNFNTKLCPHRLIYLVMIISTKKLRWLIDEVLFTERFVVSITRSHINYYCGHFLTLKYGEKRVWRGSNAQWYHKTDNNRHTT